jgi:hypothetical protein
MNGLPQVSFFSSYDSAKSLPIASGPHGLITFVDSVLYLVKVDKLHKIFIPVLTSPLPATTHSTLNTLTLKLLSNIEKEAKAKKGITKLLLFHISSKLSDDSTSFGDLSYPKPAQGMRVVINSAQPACATGFSDQIRNTCAMAKKPDLMNIRSCLISIVFINKATALHLLQGNLATEEVTLLNNEADSINLSLFPPQQNTSMSNKESYNDLTACSGNNMDTANAHKSKTNVTITRIDTMVDTTNFSSLCINCNTIISTTINSTEPQPLYCQVLLKFINLLNNPDFNAWYAATKGSMPSLHWQIYPFLEQIFNLFTKFASDFSNVNVMTGLPPLAELNTKPLFKALTVLKAFEDQLTLVQSTNSPIPILAATMSKFFNRIPGINSNVGTPAPVPVSASALPENTQNQCCNVKHNLSTPDKSTKAATTQRQKKPCRNGAIFPAKQRPVTDMGIVFLAKHDIRATDIFPKDLPTKICADFTCKGPKCTRENYPYSHPRNACESTVETITTIDCHFSLKKIGWLNKWHLMKLSDLPADVKALVGGKDGPSSSKRD